MHAKSRPELRPFLVKIEREMGSKKRHAVNDAKQEKEMPEFTEIPLKKILSFQWSWKHLIPVALLALGLAFLALPPQSTLMSL